MSNKNVPWTADEDAIAIAALRQTEGRVVAASRLCAHQLARSEHAIQRRLGDMAELRASIRPIRRCDRKSTAYAPSRVPATPMQAPPEYPTLAELLAMHPRCPACRGRWYIEAELEEVSCMNCGERRAYRGRGR